MIRDKYFDQISKALDTDTLDGRAFEACAADLLGSIYPGLAPIPGGNDSGMDGTIPNPDGGPPLPLISTTQSSAIDNLTKSLESFIKGGGTARKCVFATSRCLTPPKIRNLYKRADELGFNLLNVHENQAIANKLYRDSKWTFDLLGLVGEPCVLSKIPLNSRIFSETLIGRDDDLEWMEKQDTDSIVVGNSGSGKTHLAQHLIQKHRAFFLTAGGRDKLSCAIRDLQPDIIIVDDAHLHEDWISDLLHLRAEISAKFRLVLLTWPSGKETLTHMLHLNARNCRALKLLTRDEIVSVIESLRVHGSDHIIHEIVTQAEGKPGLAVTLTLACLDGDTEDMWYGNVLSRWVIESIKKTNICKSAKHVMAVLSIAGDSGFDLETVSKILNVSPFNIQQLVAELAAAGIVEEKKTNSTLIVRPPQLRYALIRDTFYAGARSIDPKSIYTLVDRKDCLADTLIRTAGRGADIDEELLIKLVIQSRSDEIWALYASLGYRQTIQILERYPHKASCIGKVGLEHAPVEMIPHLFAESISTSTRHKDSNHPLQRIENWIENFHDHNDNSIEKRKKALEACENWLRGGNSHSPFLTILPSLFEIELRNRTASPGSGMTITFRNKLLSPDSIDKLFGLWKKCFDLMQIYKFQNWESYIRSIEKVAYAGRSTVKFSAEQKKLCRDLATTMVRNVLSISTEYPGVQVKLGELAKKLKVRSTIVRHPHFDALYPLRLDSWNPSNDKYIQQLKKAAEVWKSYPADIIAERISWAEAEAERAGNEFPRLSYFLCQELASVVENPLNWGETFFKAGCSPDICATFICHAIYANYRGWKAFSLSYMDTTLGLHLVRSILIHADSDDEILDAAIARYSEYQQKSDYGITAAPNSTMLRLLQHDSCQVRRRVSINIWYKYKDEEIPVDLLVAWKSAVLENDANEYFLQEILLKHTDLAHQWILKVLNDEWIDCSDGKLLKKLIPSLDAEDRRRILDEGRTSKNIPKFINEFVHDDESFFDAVLGDEFLKKAHLRLANCLLRPDWEIRILKILRSGYAKKEIARSLAKGPNSYMGQESDTWKRLLPNADKMMASPYMEINLVGRELKAILDENISRSMEDERHREIYGKW